MAEKGSLRALLVLAGSTGGIGAHVASLTRGLTQRGVEVAVCGPQSTEELFGFAAAGAEFTPADIGPKSRPLADTRAIRAIKKASADCAVVHAHGLRAGTLAATALHPISSRSRRVPLVVTLHNAMFAHGAAARAIGAIERRVARSADIMLGASSDLVHTARDLGSPDARLCAIASPDGRPATRAAAEVRDELGATGRPLLLAAGRLAIQKDYPLLLDALAKLSSRQPAPVLAIAGEGPERTALQRRIDAEGLPAVLLGRRGDVPDLLGAADLLVLSSRWEARSLVAQEALRAGVPVVGTEVGGLPELLGDAAALVPHGDAAALAETVGRLLDDPAARADLARRGRQRAAGWPQEDDTTAQVLSIYDELVERSAKEQ